MAQSNELERMNVPKKVWRSGEMCFFFNNPDFARVVRDVMKDLFIENSSVIKLMYLSNICTGPDDGKTRHD